MTKVRAQLYTGMPGALRSAESPLHGADDFRKFMKESAPIMTGETAFPLRCYDSYPFASCSREPTASDIFTTDRAEKVRSFLLSEDGRFIKNAQSAL